MLKRVSAIVVTLVCFSAPPLEARELTFGVHPFLSAVELQARFNPLLKYVQTRIGWPVKLQISSSYAELVEKCVAAEVDFAFMGPSSYIQARQRNPHLQLLGVAESEIPGLRGVIIVRTDSPLQQLAELKHKRVAFAAPDSTMGFQVPAYLLMQQGVCLVDLDAYSFVGNHQNVAYAVLAGRFDAGAVKYEVYEEMQNLGLRILLRLPDVVDHPFVATPRLEARMVGRIQTVLQEMHNNEEGKKILTKLRADMVKIAPSHDADFAKLRTYVQHAHECLRSAGEK
ncbi:MAG: phosphate/phosphite/phosphonate ABC transporter substrate-binding protein [Desulfuromonadaceae bacterium]|nr:phosphate/phosphite/phosphonate ABC transporter substrate-binding protein [Desulfuromonadaceae bacterium]